MPKLKQKTINLYFDRGASQNQEMKDDSIQPEQQYQCGDCGSLFDDIAALDQHGSYACKKKKFECEICNGLFASKYSLKTHKQVKHDGNSKKHPCEFCDKSFPSKGQLVVHKRCHTKEKVFVCSVCGKGFSHRESLVTHSTIHTGIRVSYHHI